MKSYRDRYDELESQRATIIAVSTDKQAKQADFKRSIGAAFSFVADEGGHLTKLYGVKTPLVTYAKRTTFVIGTERRVLHIDTGGDAVDTSGAAQACSLYGA
jgi:peroxiredoxin